MDRKMAELVVNEFKKKNGPQLTILEAMTMTKIMSSGYKIYALQKGDVTFLVWKREDGSIITKIQCW